MKGKKVVNMSQKEITDNYNKIVGNRRSGTPISRGAEEHLEFGHFKRATILRDSAISYSSSSSEKRFC